MKFAGLAVDTALVLAGCASTPPDADEPPTNVAAATQRLDAIDAAVADWARAETLAEAKSAAEAARNFIVGDGHPFYGDADGDGTVAGAAEAGLLPGPEGEAGLADEVANPCVEADVLGGSWADPAERWANAQAAYDTWTRSHNTMPSLPSHPQRVVGWATFTLASDSLDEAHECASHAQIHARITRNAILDCSDH